MTSLKVKDETLLSSKELFRLPPHFGHLTHLDLVLCRPRPLERHLTLQSTKLIEVPHLRHLRMTTEVFTAFNDRCVNFDSAKNLQSIELMPYALGEPIAIDFNKIRSFISSRKHLIRLHLSGPQMTSIFNEPLKIHSQLKKFSLTRCVDEQLAITNVQQDNLCDFIDSQRALKSMKVDDFQRIESHSTKMTRLRSKRLDLPFTEHRIRMTSNLQPDLGNIGLEYFSLDELQAAVTGSTNITTKHLAVDHRRSTFVFNQTIQLIVAKFSNLTSLEVLDFTDNYYLGTISDSSSLNTLQHLRILKLACNSWTHLKDVTIPTLEILELAARSEIDLQSNTVIKFVGRHHRVHQLKLRIDTCCYDPAANHNKILKRSLLNLEELKTFEVSYQNLVEKQTKVAEDLILKLIRNHARLGFIYKRKPSSSNAPVVIMKRHDGHVVRYNSKKEKWEKVFAQK